MNGLVCNLLFYCDRKACRDRHGRPVAFVTALKKIDNEYTLGLSRTPISQVEWTITIKGDNQDKGEDKRNSKTSSMLNEKI